MSYAGIVPNRFTGGFQPFSYDRSFRGFGALDPAMLSTGPNCGSAKNIQTALNDLGYGPLGVDGVLGQKSYAAMDKFGAAVGIGKVSYPSAAFCSALKTGLAALVPPPPPPDLQPPQVSPPQSFPPTQAPPVQQQPPAGQPPATGIQGWWQSLSQNAKLGVGIGGGALLLGIIAFVAFSGEDEPGRAPSERVTQVTPPSHQLHANRGRGRRGRRGARRHRRNGPIVMIFAGKKYRANAATKRSKGRKRRIHVPAAVTAERRRVMNLHHRQGMSLKAAWRVARSGKGRRGKRSGKSRGYGGGYGYWQALPMAMLVSALDHVLSSAAANPQQAARTAVRGAGRVFGLSGPDVAAVQASGFPIWMWLALGAGGGFLLGVWVSGRHGDKLPSWLPGRGY